jgi:MFS family permease
MRRAIDLLRREATARTFFAAFTQSALGTGAAYVALLLVAYDRFRSPWAISAVLIAELLPPMFLGPVLGAIADRWSRRGCVVLADIIRALAFAGVAAVHGFELTIALTFVAGAGTALFTPASLAALPSLVKRAELPAATSLYGAISDLGLAVGPALAAAILVFSDAESILVINAVTFLISALILARLDFGQVPDKASARPSLITETRQGVHALRETPGLGAVLGASALALFFAGLVNVAELPFITGELNASQALYSAAVAVAGAGIVVGSLSGAAGGGLVTLRRRYLLGLFVMGLGNLLSGAAFAVGMIFGTFAFAGFGNGMMLVYERLIIQATVPEHLSGRVFGTKDALTAWAFGLSFLVAGALISVAGNRTAILAAGAGILAAAALAGLRMRFGREPAALTDRSRAQLALDGAPREHGSDFVGGRDHWLALLDDLGEGGDDDGIELGPRVRR